MAWGVRVRQVATETQRPNSCGLFSIYRTNLHVWLPLECWARSFWSFMAAIWEVSFGDGDVTQIGTQPELSTESKIGIKGETEVHLKLLFSVNKLFKTQNRIYSVPIKCRKGILDMSVCRLKVEWKAARNLYAWVQGICCSVILRALQIYFIF